MDLTQHYGELAAAATAVFWTITALSFEVASKRIGSFAVNLFRLTFAFVFLCVFNYINRGYIFPTDANLHSWLWLALSGLVGLVFGDYLLFHSYVIIGSRIAMLVMTLVPPMTALIGWLMLGEKMSGLHVFGMFLTMSGIGMAILSRPEGEGGRKLKLSYPIKGIL